MGGGTKRNQRRESCIRSGQEKKLVSHSTCAYERIEQCIRPQLLFAELALCAVRLPSWASYRRGRAADCRAVGAEEAKARLGCIVLCVRKRMLSVRQAFFPGRSECNFPVFGYV